MNVYRACVVLGRFRFMLLLAFFRNASHSTIATNINCHYNLFMFIHFLLKSNHKA